MFYHVDNTQLIFDERFNKPIDDIKFPDSIQSITFGGLFDQLLDQVKFPDSLQTITFGDCFNQPLDQVKFPNSLQTITFGSNFNQSLDHIKFPNSLQNIIFGWYFDQSLDNLPNTILNLTFCKINRELTNLPISLEKIILFTGYLKQSLTKIKKLPFGCVIIGQKN